MKYLIAPLIAACCLASAVAAPHAVLTLPSALELAMHANPELAAARREIDALGFDAAQAGHFPNPTIDYLREGEADNGATTVQLSIPIELGGKRAARRQVANVSLDLGRQALALTRARVRADTVLAYSELYLAGERLRLVQAGAALAAASTATAARRVQAGKLSPVEETRARVAEANVRIELLQAERDQALARQRLAALLPPSAPPFDSVAAPASALPRLPELAGLMVRLEQSPAMAQARLEVLRRTALAQVELARRAPDLTVLVGSKRERSLGERNLGAGGDKRQLVLGVSVPLPLFDRNTGAVLAALRRVDRARDDEAAALVKLRLELQQAHARLASALQEIALIDADIVPGAQSAFDAASRGFELGKFSHLEVLDARRTLFQSMQQHVRAVAEAQRAAFDIAVVTGESE